VIPIALAALLGPAMAWRAQPSALPQAPFAAGEPETAEPDWAALIGPFPAAGSPRDDQDLAALLRLQASRTPADVERIQGGEHLGLESFSAALGDGFDPGRYPLTASLLAKAGRDVKDVVEPLKDRFGRPRPCLSHPEVHPVSACREGFSYPSFHAARGVLFAMLLADLVPERAPALQARGLQIGGDRALGGMHYPSDVLAGQRLGAAFLPFWLRHSRHARMLEDARQYEWHGRPAAPVP